MAVLNSNALTLNDWAKRIDPKGKVDGIVELLAQTNEMLSDMLFVEGNLPTGHQATIRTGLPDVYFRMINQGIPSSKSTTAQVIEHCAMLEAWSEIDKDEAELNGNVKDYRMSENMAFIEALNQKMQETFISGSASNPEELVGLQNRYNSLSAANAENIISAEGSSGKLTSIYLCGWGGNTVFGTFPKGSKVGIQHEDLGLVTVETTAGVAGSRMRAYQDHWQWKAGLVVKDWRYCGRIPNISVADLLALSNTQAVTASTFLPKLMSRMIDRMPTLAGIKPCFYANRTVLSLLRVAALEKSSSALSITESLNQFGETIYTTRFNGIPVRLVDKIGTDESVVA